MNWRWGEVAPTFLARTPSSPQSMSTFTQQHRAAYDPLALIYNRSMAEDFCHRAWPVIEQLLLSRIPSAARVLDLCCGSGQMARELSQRGYEVVGLDGSEQMLELARQNAPFASFVLADARRFSFPPSFHAVLSSFNSLAHAAVPDELTCILRNAHSALKSNGAMLFDLSMEEAYTSKWHGTFGESRDDASWTVCPSYDRSARSAQNHVTVSRRNGASWERTECVITQRCFSEEEVRTALTQSGFTTISSYDAEHDLGMSNESGRSFFLCA